MTMNRRGLILFIGMIFLIGILGTVIVEGQVSGLASATTFQPRASVQTVYGSDLTTYWPILGDKNTCEARQDLLLQVAPAGCTPSVVRSDLLAEQNVPVFCQIDALQVNPLIDIQQIKSISFSGNYPKDIIGAGYYPAKAALKSRDKLLGSPLINNIGYVVVILKRNEKEKDLPDYVNVTLRGQIAYEAGNVFGIGKAEFILEPTSDYDWDSERFKQSFWNGRYFVRLEKVEADYVIVSLYEGVRKIATMKVKKGEISDTVWAAGAYCRAGVQVAFDDLITLDKNRAIIDISDEKGTDRVTVYPGSRFLNDKCSVEDIKIYTDGLTGEVSIKCNTGEKFVLKLGGKNESRLYLSENYDAGKKIEIFYDAEKKKNTGWSLEGSDVYILDNYGIGNIDDKIITIDKDLLNLHFNGETGTDTDKLNKLASDSGVSNSEYISFVFNKLDGAKIDGDKITSKGASDTGTSDKDLGEMAEKEFKDAIAALEKVADDYPAEREKDLNISKVYGEEALNRAINLAETAGKETEKARLMKKFINTYPDSAISEEYKYRLNRMQNIDYSNSVGLVKIDNEYKNIRLVDLEKPKKISSADFSIAGVVSAEKITINAEQLKNVTKSGIGFVESIRLDKVLDEDNVAITANCIVKQEAGKAAELKSQSFNLKAHDKAKQICDKSYITLESVNLEKIAKIRLVPKSQGTEILTNLTVTIGIEKRAIKLSTDKTEEMIKNLNESIKKWENINKNLGKVVEGLKGACFATAGVLTVKNFITGLSGEALARNKVMQGENGWNRKCANMVSMKIYDSLTECYNKNSDAIGKDVSETQKIIEDMNNKISSIEQKYPISGTGFLGMEKGVDRSKAAVDYCNNMKTNYGTESIVLKNGEKKTLSELLGDCDKSYNTEGAFGYEQLREIEYDIRLKNSDASPELKNTTSLLQSSYQTIYDNRQRYNETQTLMALGKSGVPVPAYVSSKAGRANIVTQVLPSGGMANDVKPIGIKSEYVATVNVDDSSGGVGKDTGKGFAGGVYYVGLTKNPAGGYSITEVFNKDKTIMDDTKKGEFLNTYNIGGITAAESVSYVNTYSNPEVKYYEREPYKGMPAIVPFDVQEGWYAATKQTLPIMGGTKAFDESGRVMSFYLCNVGKNGREQFFEGLGDDICQQINLNTGQPLGFFPGLDETKAKKRVSQAIQALNDAADQYGKKSVLINGRNYLVGAPAASIPSAQCQNFMSPEDCKILFNVCDPVVCPSSRCDFGGKWPVADVIQSGIIGSTLLCLPNVKEGIIIPVCLTGIHAGIEGYISILKNHRDCLQESLSSGKMIGLCDQIYSIYLCEFFWRQIAPVAKVLLPKLIESAYGEGTRGGGEYLSVMAAWQNTENSINYFTQSYAVNSMKAYQLRSVEEAGTPICKAFVSAKFPTNVETLVEPDSPPQFHAWFSSTKYTDATVPATSQYKVFYHIYAGKDSGVQYSVYLKNPPESSYFAVPAIVQVAYGFVGKGQYASESRDFTAPEGYKELCVRVNEQEECGFGEVSTSMALDYLSDSYAASEIDTKNIKSEAECISGTSNFGAVALNPNIATGVEGVVSPEVSQRGIVRICATNNPGSQTNPTRFVEVGYCGDQKIKCWIDKESVKNAISDSDKLLQNATLSNLEATQQATLAAQGVILDESSSNAEIKDYEIKVEQLKKGLNSDLSSSDEAGVRSEINATIERMNLLFGIIVLNHHKANVLYLIGDLKASLAEKDVIKNKIAKATVGLKEAAAVIVGEARPSVTPSESEKVVFSLRKAYNKDSTEKNYIYINGKITKLYISESYLYINGREDLGHVGLVNDVNRIVLYGWYEKEITQALGGNEDYFSTLFMDQWIINGQKISSGGASTGSTESGTIVPPIVFLVNEKKKDFACNGDNVQVKIEHSCEVEYKVIYTASDGKTSESIGKLAKDINIFDIGNVKIGEYTISARCAGQSTYAIQANLKVESLTGQACSISTE